jgi:hypothetical protein
MVENKRRLYADRFRRAPAAASSFVVVLDACFAGAVLTTGIYSAKP